MMQEVKQTDEEKLAMYMKLSKEEIAAMLVQSNKHLDALLKTKSATTVHLEDGRKYNRCIECRRPISPDKISCTSCSIPKF